jgi:hypothetical protein
MSDARWEFEQVGGRGGDWRVGGSSNRKGRGM